jgi:hypothetical protein
MQYQFAGPFIVDSTLITERLGVKATPIDQALVDTMRSYAGTGTPTKTAQ